MAPSLSRVTKTESMKRQNPVGAKTQDSKCYTNNFSRFRAPIPCEERSVRRKNSIPDFKKEYREFNRHVSHSIRWLITAQDRFPQGKNLSNNGDTRLPSNRGNNRENGHPVTTNHVLLPRRRGKAAFLLPIWQPNSDFLGGKHCKRAERGGLGVKRGAAAKSALPISSHGILAQMGLCSIPLALKKARFAARRNSDPSRSASSCEPATIH
jgi:hypothetical protein